MKKLLLVLFFLGITSQYKSGPLVRISDYDHDIYYSKGIDETIKYLENMTKVESSRKALYHAKMGYYYYEEKDYRNAEKMLKKALSEDPEMEEVYLKLGALYTLQGQSAKALEYYLAGTKLKEKYPDMFFGAGVSYFDMDNFEKAAEYLERAVNMYKMENKEEQLNRAVILLYYSYDSIGDDEKMEKFLKRAIERDINKAVFSRKLSELYYAQGMSKTALRYIHIGMRDEPEHPDNYYLAGVLYYETKKYKKSEEYFRQAVKLYSDEGNDSGIARAYDGIYYIKNYSGTKDELEEFLKTSIGNNVNKANFCSHLAAFYIKERRFSDALKYNLEGIKADSYSMENYFGAGISYYYKGELDNAVKYFEEAAKLYRKTDNKEYLGETYAFLYKTAIENNDGEKAAEVENAAKNDLGSMEWERKKK
ncbi:tetratricopeptide repeat protein [Sebaldella sp. S0638]|uniref:tetratricopeptide repeat protein n=1 Tax=Sebaldella sp. S0638 TaxID=2957809 RepID=UPI0020A206D7|nr:tetratricopeptide repeat protein [Sebaldella sp. S0638]MCP1224463.1 tetratricopeptide repeat protein [Sebaldella sp. S0638]